jgi:hypothetical protein
MSTDQRSINQQSYAAARESFSGRLLTDSQFEDLIAITEIIKREIHKTGLFKEKLSDYAHAFSRTQKFDQIKTQTIIRDLYKEHTGMTLNQTREKLLSQEESLSPHQRYEGLKFAEAVEPMMRDGNKISFNRAASRQAADMAAQLKITEVGAKRIMAETFKEKHGEDFYSWGKDVLDEQYFRPQIDAERRQRSNEQQKSVHRQHKLSL